MISPRQALALAIQLHAGQLDKAGAPYWEHCQRVQDRCKMLPSLSNDALVAAALHDVIEDDKASAQDLYEKHGVQSAAIDLILQLSRRPGQDYDAYIESLAHCGSEAWAIKMADLHDNLDPLRLYCLQPGERKRLYHKYNAALRRFLDIGAC